MRLRTWQGLAFLVLVVACGSDEEGDGSGGSGGSTGGTGATAGTGGTGGSAGSGGVSGTGGTGATGATGGTAGTAGSAGTAGTAGSAGSAGSAGTAGTGGSGAGCPATVSNATLCLTSATGSPGDTVNIGLYALQPAGCTGVAAVGGPIELNDDYFLVVNPVNQTTAQSGSGAVTNCTEYHSEVGYDSIHVWTWGQWSESCCCDQLAPSGLYIELQIQIAPSTPAGVYPIAWATGLLLPDTGQPAACGDDVAQTRIDGAITVN